MAVNLLLIDSRVNRYKQIEFSVNSSTQVIVFDFQNDTLETLVNQMYQSEYESIGLIQHNYNLPTYQMLGTMTPSIIMGVLDQNLDSWDQILGFLNQLRDTKKITNFDFMACALESDTNWKKVLDYLRSSTGINIRASFDKTGSSSLGGNWFLETGSANLTDIYFTSNINNYKGTLGDPSSVNSGFITTTGNLYVYGSNNSGQISSLISPTILPSVYPSMSNVKSVSFGSSYNGGFVLILKNDGTVYSCGDNVSGQLGNNTLTSTNIPVQVLGVDGSGNLSNIKQVSAGLGFSLFLDNSGNVYSCGNNSTGQLGINTTAKKTTPVRVLGLQGSGFLSNIKQITAGDYHSLFLDNSGNVYSCGFNSFGELGIDNNESPKTVPIQVKGLQGLGTLSNIKQITAGSYYSIFLDNSGNVFSCGYNIDGELGDGTNTQQYAPVKVKGVQGSGLEFLSNISQIAAGNYQSLFLDNSGNVYSCGYNNFGQLGNGTTDSYNVPVQVSDIGGSGFLSNIKQISSGQYYSVFLDNSGNIYSCGNNYDGQLGINSASYSCVVIQILGLGGTGIISNINQMTGGYGFNLFLDNSGNVYSCGDNSSGQLGINNNTDSGVLVQVLGGDTGTTFLSSIKQIAAGSYHSLFLDNSGNVYACGYNDDGELGNGTNDESDIPVQVVGAQGSGKPFLSNINQIAAGDYHSLFIDNSGNVYACGYNEYGELGNGNNTDISYNTPLQVLGGAQGGTYLSNIKQVAAGGYHSLFLDNSGNVYGCGYNQDGELGNSSNIDSNIPVQVKGVGGSGYLSNIKQIAAGEYSSYFLDNSGNVYSCGYNGDGELGNNTTRDSNVPVRVKGVGGSGYLLNIKQIASCYYSPLFLDYSGNVYSCGYNDDGELGDNTNIQRNIPVQVLALGGSGLLSNIEKINAGGSCPLFLDNNKNVYGCGDNSFSQLGNNFISDSNIPVKSLSPVSNIAYLNGVPIITITPTLGPFTPPTPKNYGDPSFNLTDPSSNSPGSWSYSSSNTLVATITGNTVTIVGAGIYTITATQSAYGNYTEAIVTSSTLTINKAYPTLGPFTPPTPKTYGDSPFILTDPSSNSPGSWSYSTSNPLVATISGNTVTIVGAGNYTITATQAASDNYTEAIITSSTLTINKAYPTLGAFTVPTPKNYGDSSFNLTNPSSNSPGSWSYSSSNPLVATISGNIVTIVGVGSTNITGTQAATSNYYSASTPATPLIVNKGTPVLGSFTPPTPKNVNDPPFTITPPTSTSNGSWSYTSSDTSVVTISGNIATILKIGTYTITANQAGTDNYTPTSITSSTLSIINPPTIGPFTPPTPQTYGDPPFTLTDPSSNSNGSWSYTSSNPNIVTISGSTATIVGYGNYTITAIQAPSGIYTEGRVTSSTLTINPNQIGVYNANQLMAALSSNYILIILLDNIYLNSGQTPLINNGPLPKIIISNNGFKIYII